MSRALNVWYQDRKVGRLLDSGGGRMAFIYDGDWLDDGWAKAGRLGDGWVAPWVARFGSWASLTARP